MSLEDTIRRFFMFYLVDVLIDYIGDIANDDFYDSLGYSDKKRLVIAIARNVKDAIFPRLKDRFSLFSIDAGFSVNSEYQEAFCVIFESCFRSDDFMNYFADDVLSYEKTDENGVLFHSFDVNNPFYDVRKITDKSIKFAVKAIAQAPQHAPAVQAEPTPKGNGGNTIEKKPTPVDEFLAELINKHGEGIKQLRVALLDSHDLNRRYKFDDDILTLKGMNIDVLPLTSRQFTLSSRNLSERKKKLKSLGLIE